MINFLSILYVFYHSYDNYMFIQSNVILIDFNFRYFVNHLYQKINQLIYQAYLIIKDQIYQLRMEVLNRIT